VKIQNTFRTALAVLLLTAVGAGVTQAKENAGNGNNNKNCGASRDAKDLNVLGLTSDQHSA
jgi:hypothetical protein